MKRALRGWVLAGVLLLGATLAQADESMVSLSHWGAQVDVGIPDGAGLNAVWRPKDWLRAEVGLATNLSTVGVRAGATFIPFKFVVAPSFTLEYGHFFTGKAGFVLAQAIGTEGAAADTLKKLSYDYVNGHLGVEFLPQGRFCFFLHLGMSYLVARTHDFQPELRKIAADPTLEANDPVIRLTVPSVKLGFILFFG